MSLKMKQIIKNFIKISTLSLIFILSFFIISTFANIEKNQKVETKPGNSVNYRNIEVKPISHVAVAISINIWLWLNREWDINQTHINNRIFTISQFYSNSDIIRNSLIKTNMLFTKEYFNIMRMDFAWILKKSNNKSQTLNNIIRQLEIRLKNAHSNLQTLNKQKTILLAEYKNILTKIEILKKELERDFNQNKPSEVFKHIDLYYDLKQKEIILKTNIVFINNFIRRYIILNKHNSRLLNALILNKDIISKNSYIVIPNSWTQILKEFNLLFTESTYK